MAHSTNLASTSVMRRRIHRTALIDGALAFVFGLTMAYATVRLRRWSYHRAHLTYVSSSTVSSIVVTMVIFALIVSMFSRAGAERAAREGWVRSRKRSIYGVVVMIVLPSLILWVVNSWTIHSWPLFMLVGTIGSLGPFGAVYGYRWYGFVKPATPDSTNIQSVP